MGICAFFLPKHSAPPCQSVPHLLLVKVVLCSHKSYTRTPAFPWVIFLKSHKQIHHDLHPHLSHYVQHYHASLMKKGFGRGEQLRDWWEVSSSTFWHVYWEWPCHVPTPFPSVLHLALGQNKEITAVTSSIQQKHKQTKDPNKNKSRRNQKLQYMDFLQGFPPFSEKAATLLSNVAATSKTRIIFWNGIN